MRSGGSPCRPSGGPTSGRDYPSTTCLFGVVLFRCRATGCPGQDGSRDRVVEVGACRRGGACGGHGRICRGDGLVRDHRPSPARGHDRLDGLQLSVDPCDRARRDAQVPGELADRRQPGTSRELHGADQLHELAVDLPPGSQAAVRVEDDDRCAHPGPQSRQVTTGASAQCLHPCFRADNVRSQACHDPGRALTGPGLTRRFTPTRLPPGGRG